MQDLTQCLKRKDTARGGRGSGPEGGGYGGHGGDYGRGRGGWQIGHVGDHGGRGRDGYGGGRGGYGAGRGGYGSGRGGYGGGAGGRGFGRGRGGGPLGGGDQYDPIDHLLQGVRQQQQQLTYHTRVDPGFIRDIHIFILCYVIYESFKYTFSWIRAVLGSYRRF